MKVVGCARCGGDHDVTPRKLVQPFAPPECAPVVWTHWAPCPTNGDPIMVIVGDDVAAREDDGLTGSKRFENALPIVYQVFCERRAAPAKAEGRAGSTYLEEVAAFESTVREFYGKWKPQADGRPFVDVVFDSLPGPDGCHFVELEDENGCGISFGEWVERGQRGVASFWALRIPRW